MIPMLGSRQYDNMTDEKAVVESILDEHYFYFVSLIKTYYNQVTEDQDKRLCMQWLSKLLKESVRGVSEKRNRNIFFSHLLMNMQEGKMTGPFLEVPSDEPLALAVEIFGPQEFEEEASLPNMADNFGNEMETPEDDYYRERSADGRTYIAIRNLPDNRGTYAFVALSIDKDELSDKANVTYPPCGIDKSKLRHIKALRKLSNGTTTLTGNPSQAEMAEFYIRNIEAKVSGDLSELYKTLRAPIDESCGGKKNEVAFYDVLLKQIDEEITGIASGDNDLVKFLVRRLAQDLKKVPEMRHVFSLSKAQRNLKLLEILRQKLIVRQQEEKRTNLLAEIEESMLASVDQETCTGKKLNDAPTEAMWQLAITKPLSDHDIDRLYGAYPEEAILVFLDLLTEDRQSILDQGKKRQRIMIESMRSEVYKEVQCGKAKYNKARTAYREWNEILSMVEELMYESGNEAIEDEERVPYQKGRILDSMLGNTKETEYLVMEEARVGEALTENIANANMWSFPLQENNDKRDVTWELKLATESIRKEIVRYRLLIDRQERRIKQLRDQLDYL